ncbi:MAG TPA: phospholipase D-like domain-containing protein [Pyrinomonadaceae bacterium]
MPVTPEQLEQVIRQFSEQDPALYQELQNKVGVPSTEAMEAATRDMVAAAALPPLTEPGALELSERLSLETIVRPLARPVLIIRDNQVTTEFLGPDSDVWKSRIETAKPILDRIIPAVGRVEVTNNPDFTWLGTGWLVADDIIVTNRHVAQEFGRRGANGFTFRMGLNGGAMTSRLDFLEEDQRFNSLEYAVNSILFIAKSTEPDVAFLRLVRPQTSRPFPPPIVLADQITGDEFIATIGYPARDSRVPDQDLVLRIFGDVYEKKRLAPGKLISVAADELQHDCSTLGGNSGSPTIDLTSGNALGLHFSGLFMQANFAVPAPRVRELLTRVQRGEIVVASTGGGAPSAVSAAPPPPSPAPNTFTLQLNVPIEVTVKVGTATSVLPVQGAGTAPGVAGGNEFERALQAAREAFGGDSDITEIRLGYRFKRGWITDERVVVVETRKKMSTAELTAAGKQPLPPQILGVGVDVRTAALRDQLESLGVDMSFLEAPARPGRYREPTNVFLERVQERMRVVFHVSPDSGFPNLRDFIRRVQRHLTATMYEWDPNHISDEIEAAMSGANNSLRMVTQREGTREAVEEMSQRIGAKFNHVFASVGSGKLIPTAYHIKVASRDGEEFWLSSGNWKDSNQANIDPAGDNATNMAPLRQHNREWHAVIANQKLATMFQKFIEFDFSEAQRVPVEEGVELILPDVFVPEAAFMEDVERVTVDYFDPLIRDREFDIQPLLTPDRDARGHRLFIETAIDMMRRGTQKIYVENQSFNLLDEENNNDELVEFFEVLRDKQQAGVDVRIIFRDAREFGASNGPKQQKLLERLKDFGIDTDFIKVQRKCHTKGIIVDGKEVMLGSHNITNQGSLFNRDASLLVRDPEVAGYFEKVFLFDWNTLATQETDELVGGMRIAQPGEETPLGFRRVSLAELMGES